MGNTLYLECYSGISGDMTVASLLDLGADEQVLRKALATLPVDGFEVVVKRVKKSGLDACDFDVKLDAAHENHDHDMEYLHGHEHHQAHDQHAHAEHHGHEHHGHEHVHEHHAHEHHDHGHQEHGHTHPHEHRGFSDVVDIINGADITENARELAKRVFHVLAKAESKAHGVPMDQVHFHEVGAVDSIVDVVSVAVCLDDLNITDIIVPFVCEGSGTIRCQHGILPVPVPAVANIIQAENVRMKTTSIEGELVTPTGAAIVGALRTSDTLPEQFDIKRIGLGAGKREYEGPGFLRAMLIQSKENDTKDLIYKLETNVDDCTGEQLGVVMERLFAAGARDVHYTPVYMKKNRPAYQLNVICNQDQIPALEQIIFRETTTIGIRRAAMERSILPREQRMIQTEYGEIAAKCCTLPDGEVRCYPEYEAAAEAARREGISYTQVCEAVKQIWKNKTKETN